MDKALMDSLAQILHRQRENFLQEFRKAEEGLVVMAEERESELEEHAQEEQSARLLKRLDDRTLYAVREIDAALERILKGAYGSCERCRKVIPVARLRAVPATRFCKRCAARSEVQTVTGAEKPPSGPIPADLRLLNDRELGEVILEQLRDDGRIDLEEMRVVCRKGVVYLSGALPSEVEHQILLNTLTDVLGFGEIVDHLEVEELLWENEKRTKEMASEKTLPWQEPPATEDIVESDEEGRDFVAPAKPTPQEE